MPDVRIKSAQLVSGGSGWRWRTLGGNGEILGWSEAYERKADATASLKAHLPVDFPDASIVIVEGGDPW